MYPRHKTRSTIVPGQRMITEQAAYYQAGIIENVSYLAEKTVVEDSSLNDTRDNEEREWRKQGLSEKQIHRIYEKRKLTKLKNAENRLNKEKYGAKNFQELLDRHEYSERESDDEENATIETNVNRVQVFAIPALPKHLTEKSMFGSPVSGTKGSGKAGLSCSTPKSANDVSMRSLKALDISHVVAVDQLDTHKVTVQSKTVMLPITESTTETSSPHKTYVIQQRSESESIAEKQESSLQKTFTIPDSSPQKTFNTHESSAQEVVATDSSRQKTHTIQETSMQNSYVIPSSSPQKEQQEGETNNDSVQNSENATFVVGPGWKNTLLDSVRRDQEERAALEAPQDVSSTSDPPVVQDKLQGGEKKKKKIGLLEREKRAANSSLMSSMIEDMPSPGAGLFRNTRKKLRPMVAGTPQRATKLNRLSTESDKEKTIDMLSIAEEFTDNETNGSSFADPISVNGSSRVSPVAEVEEEIMDVSKNDVTPKSRRITPRNSSLRERVRAQSILATPGNITKVVDDDMIPPATTPKHNYQKPTFSSLVKSKNAAESNDLLEATRKDRKNTPRRPETIHEDPVTSNDGEEEEASKAPNTEGSDKSNNISNDSITNIRTELNGMSVRDPPSTDYDYGAVYDDVGQDMGPDYQFDDDYDQGNQEEEEEAETSSRQKSTRRRRVELLSDSIATVNTPGVRTSRRQNMNDTEVDDQWSLDQTARMQTRGGRKNKNVGLLLKKREIIAPATPDDNLRRSTRNRVKPVRSWLGEQPVYVHSPSGGKRLTGVTEVIVKDKRLCKYRTGDVRLANEREQKERARKKQEAAERRRQLAADQRKGRRLNESQDEIHTDDDDE